MRSDRRTFLKVTSAGLATCTAARATAVLTKGDAELFSIERTVAHSGFDGKLCWVHARAGAIPAGQPGNESENPLVVMTMQKLLLSGSDVFYALHETRSADAGETWTTPMAHPSFARQKFDSSTPAQLPTGAAIAPSLLQNGDETTVCDFSPMWHAASQRLLGVGQTVWYRDNRVMHLRPRGIAYAVYDARSNRWSAWDTVELPREPRFQSAGAGSVQRGRSRRWRLFDSDVFQGTNTAAVFRCRRALPL